MDNNSKLVIKKLTSCAKVFPDKIYGKGFREVNVAKGQEFSFQIAYKLREYDNQDYSVKVESQLKEHIKTYRVGLVGSLMPAYPQSHDNDYLRTKPGLFPDVLYPDDSMRIRANDLFWQSLWITINIPQAIETSKQKITIKFCNKNETVSVVTFNLIIHDCILPKQDLIFTQWFHIDSIASVHGVRIFSKKHWELIKKYMLCATEHGMNMVLTPILTPPLDTEINGERPTVQLVDIEKKGEKYHFSFDKLEKFIEIAKESGIEYYEINHFFTQWGCVATPKVIATVDGRKKKIFGWNVSSGSDEYKRFLEELIPYVIDVFAKNGISKDKLFFHVSDEPSDSNIDNYKYCSTVLRDIIGKDANQIDALSHFDFYLKKIVKTPVVGIDAIDTFIEAGVDNLWGYYCCAQTKNVSNRFIGMPSYRNRVIGLLIYKYGLKGFLHWGYNYYYSRLSVRDINPYIETSSDISFPSGDAFSVYPYKDGVIPSLRQKVFAYALEDVRLLNLAEKKIGKVKTIELIEKVFGQEIRFKNYPKADAYEKMYKEIFKVLDGKE